MTTWICTCGNGCRDRFCPRCGKQRSAGGALYTLLLELEHRLTGEEQRLKRYQSRSPTGYAPMDEAKARRTELSALRVEKLKGQIEALRKVMDLPTTK